MTEHRPPRFWQTPPLWMALPVIALFMVAVAVGVWVLTGRAQDAEDGKQSVGQAAVQQAVTVQQLCDGGGEVAKALEAAGQCEQAERVQAAAEDAGVDDSDTRVVALTPDRDELLRFVRDSVVSYCAGRDNCRPDAAVLIETVAAYLRANPVEPGRAPTPEEVATAARTVLTTAPELFRGEPGEQGDPGPGPSDEQVLAQVAAFCSDQDRCRGARGDQGAQGPGVAEFFFARNDAGQCEAVVVFVNPASGEQRTERRAAGDAACGPVPAPEDDGLLPGG